MAGTRRADLAFPAAGVLAATAIGIVIASLDPQLAGSTRPHPTLAGSPSDAVWIVQNNVRVLAVPFLLVAFGFPQRRPYRAAGDLIVTALVAASTIPVGLELGRWQARLLPYLPQLPFEWTALMLAVHAWIIARPGHLNPRRLAPLAAIVLTLVVCAAGLETWATPHRPAHRLDTARDPAVGEMVGCLPPGLCTGHGQVASRLHAPFPSLPSVPLGRLAGAAGISSTNDPPQGGIT
jgi:hypothetical protein